LEIKGDRLLFKKGGFDKSNPYKIYEKVACPLLRVELTKKKRGGFPSPL
jgi:hypothetical protein